MSRDEAAYKAYVADCKKKDLPAADFAVWLRITATLGWQVLDHRQ